MILYVVWIAILYYNLSKTPQKILTATERHGTESRPSWEPQPRLGAVRHGLPEALAWRYRGKNPFKKSSAPLKMSSKTTCETDEPHLRRAAAATSRSKTALASDYRSPGSCTLSATCMPKASGG